MNRTIDVEHEDVVLRAFIVSVQSARAMLKYTDALLYKKTGLSTVKFIVLQVLDSNNGVMMPSEIADWTQTERHNITALVDRMKQDGLVSTERNSRNRRYVDVSLTDKGRQILGQAMPVAKEVVSQVMSLITKSNAALLEKLLRVLRQNAQSGLEGIIKQD